VVRFTRAIVIVLDGVGGAILRSTGNGDVALHPADADVLEADENSTLEVSLRGETVFLPLRRRSDLPRGTVGLAVGVPGSPWFVSGATVKLGRGSGT